MTDEKKETAADRWEVRQAEVERRANELHEAQLKELADVMQHRANSDASNFRQTELYARDVESAIAHRLLVEARMSRSLEIDERVAVAMERIAKLLDVSRLAPLMVEK